MKVWKCPTCHTTVEVLGAKYVRHRCRYNRQRMTDFECLEDVAPTPR